MVRVQRDADAGIDLHGDVVKREGRAQGLDQASRLGHEGREIYPVCEQDGELVAAGAGQQILRRTDSDSRAAMRHSSSSPTCATEGIIDLLELVHVQQE